MAFISGGTDVRFSIFGKPWRTKDISLEACSFCPPPPVNTLRKLSLYPLQLEKLSSLNDADKYLVGKCTLVVNPLHVVPMITTAF